MGETLRALLKFDGSRGDMCSDNLQQPIVSKADFVNDDRSPHSYLNDHIAAVCGDNPRLFERGVKILGHKNFCCHSTSITGDLHAR